MRSKLSLVVLFIAVLTGLTFTTGDRAQAFQDFYGATPPAGMAWPSNNRVLSEVEQLEENLAVSMNLEANHWEKIQELELIIRGLETQKTLEGAVQLLKENERLYTRIRQLEAAKEGLQRQNQRLHIGGGCIGNC